GGGAAGLGGVRRRVGGEALVLLVVAGLIGLAMAALLPPPDGGGGGRDNAGRPPGPRPPAGDAPPYLELTDVLDAGGAGTGTGDEVVFRVEARSRALWRTMTFDRYDGRSWRLSADLDPRAFEQAQFRDVTVPPGIGEAPGSPGRDLDQRVTVETARMGLVPAAAQVRRLSLAGAAAAGPDGTVAALPPLGRGATYQARSRQAPNTPESLRPHDATVDGVPPEVGRLYLGFPGLPTRVVELAAEIAAGAPTQYDRTEAVIAWLRDNTTVRNDTGALPPGEDPLDAFLFGDRAGSAQQAATAAAVMLRSLSAPARIAVGYLPGDRGRFGGPFTVREGHAHAWVEVWFPAVGWVPFDPAGRFDAPAVTDGPSWARLMWWLLAALAVAALAWVAWRWRARRRRLQARPWSTRTYERLTRAGGRHGRPHQPAETPSEYCHALAGRLAEPRLVGVGELVTSAAWSGREPPAEARARAEAVVAAVEQSAPRRPRRGPKALVTPVRRRA
ncbi:MAG: transglutaminaseTgpA domain-containing protein, partial [Actinomycetota bacterium]